jgi:hypothetical protein
MPRIYYSKLIAGSLALGSLLLAGCSTPAPNYSPLISNVEAIKAASPAKINVGRFEAPSTMKEGAQSISLRGSSMISPVGKDYGDYLTAALRQELDLAGVFSTQSQLEVSGNLITNTINAAGISTNDAQMEARFIVKRDGRVVYDQPKRADMKWESSFAGAVAIPLAMNNYPLLVQKLIGQLFADPEFLRAVKPL